MKPSFLERLDLHLAPPDGAARGAFRRQCSVLQGDRAARGLDIVDFSGLGAVQHDRHLGALRGNLVDIPLSARLDRLEHLAAVHDAAGSVGLVGALVEDVRFVAGLIREVLRLRAAHVDAAVRVVVGPELGPQLEILVRGLGKKEPALAFVGDDRAALGAPVGVADALEVIHPLLAVDERGPATARYPGGQRRHLGTADGGKAQGKGCDQRCAFHISPPPDVVSTVYFKRNRAEMARQSRRREMAQCNQTAVTRPPVLGALIDASASRTWPSVRSTRYRPRALLEQGGPETRLTVRVVAAHPLRAMRYLLVLLLPLFAHAQPKAPALPDGAGKEQVEQLCSGCHGLARVMGSGYPQAYWHTVVRMMINFGVPIPPDQILPITDYLAKNLPEKAKPDANILPGPAKVAIREWQVPIPGSRPHDPLATRDGAIWYTGQMTNRLGRVDPKTGQVKEYPLKSPATGPHGLVEDRDGNIFYTGNHQALIGKLDPRTVEVTEYRMPDPNAKDPHSLAFAPDGMLYFTLQQSNMVGRLDPKNGEIRLVTAPTPRSRPYGIMVNAKGVPHSVLFGTNKIARIDP